MKKLILPLLIFGLLSVFQSSCENKDKTRDSFANSHFDAQVIGFISEKCFCCWGWEIKIGDNIIKADSLPNTSSIGFIINQPIPVTIETGNMKIKCGNGPNYYEIKNLTVK
jgi:hypothetical protein